MFNRIKQYIIKNDKNCLYYKKYHDLLNELIYFDYKKMTFTGSDDDVIDFSKPSMFYNNDSIEMIIALTKKKNCRPLNNSENELIMNINNLIKQDINENQFLKISLFSGLTNANAPDYGTLKNYGNSLIPRCEWSINQRSYYGFENDEDYKHLMNDLFESENPINIAFHHNWTDRYYFHCKNKSHRLAALYRQDTNQGRKTNVNMTLYDRKLNIEYGKNIFDNFIGIITTGTTYSFLVNHFKSLYIEVLFEETEPESGRLYILWIGKPRDKLLYNIIKFISLLPSDRCYVISDDLKKYINN